MLAADSRVNDSGVAVGTVAKCGRFSDGRLWAFSGALLRQQAVLEWARAGYGGEQPDMGESTFIVVNPDGRVLQWGEDAGPLCIEAPFQAWGSGFKVALGAMHAGADAAGAVAAAIDFDLMTGGPIVVLKLGEG